MRVVNTAALAEALIRARLLNHDRMTIPLVDLALMVDELNTARAATKMAGDLVAESRTMIEELCRSDLLDAERTRLRKEAGELLPRLADAVGEGAPKQNVVSTGEVVEPDTVPVPGTEIVQ